MTCECGFCGRKDVTPIRECTGKSLRMRLIREKQFGGKPTPDNLKPACRGCDSVLNTIGNCAAALKKILSGMEIPWFPKDQPIDKIADSILKEMEPSLEICGKMQIKTRRKPIMVVKVGSVMKPATKQNVIAALKNNSK